MKLTSPKADAIEETSFRKVMLESWHHVGPEHCPNCGNINVWKEKGKQITSRDTMVPSADPKLLIVYRDYCLNCKKEWKYTVFIWRYVTE